MSASKTIQLKIQTRREWVEHVLQNFDSFLVDHAASERKASATGMNFVVRYHDRPKLIETMIRYAREELYHFHQVSKLILKRQIAFKPDEKNPYVNALRTHVRNGAHQNLLDLLLVTGIVEARAHEKFAILAHELKDLELKTFYEKLTAAEAGHQSLFLDLAYHYFEDKEVDQRLDEFLSIEASVIETLPLRAAVH